MTIKDDFSEDILVIFFNLFIETHELKLHIQGLNYMHFLEM